MTGRANGKVAARRGLGGVAALTWRTALALTSLTLTALTSLLALTSLAALTLLTLTAPAVAAPGAAVPAPGAAVATLAGFDHLLHGRDVFTATGHTVPCARCHPLAKGEPRRPGHLACFGDCHGPTPVRADAARYLALTKTPRVDTDAARPQNPRGDLARLATCGACHSRADLATARPRAAARDVEREFGLQLSHQRHSAASCLLCHTLPQAARPSAPPASAARGTPHRRCSGCHDGKPRAPQPVAFALEACESCHFAAVGPRSAPTLERSRIPVTTAFSHQAHLPRLVRLGAAAARPAAQGGAAATAAAAVSSPTCLPCHRQVVEASEPGDVAAPTAETCASTGCHDGRATFGVTERCTMCHQDPPATFFAVPRPTARFLHLQHGEAQAKGGCTSCHRLRPGSGGVLEPANHQACTSCHGPDFGASAPTTCGACHTSTEPWRALRADRLPAPDTELGARMDHGKHDLPCQRCHTLDTATRQLRLPRDHSTCTGASCHQHAGAPAPLLSECQACHVAELVATRRAARQRAPWSVRRRFDHGQHKLDLEGRPAACTSCHLAVAGPLESMPTPPKRTCEPCHDGGRAFGLTGTGCARCHGASR